MSKVLSVALEQVLSRARGRLSDTADAAKCQAAVEQGAAELGFQLTGYERDLVLSRLELQQRPFGVLQAHVDDPAVSDIIVTRYDKVAVQIGRQNYPSAAAFSSKEEYLGFVERLLQRAGTSYSRKQPIADGAFLEARISAIHEVLAADGPYLTIRLNRYLETNSSELAACGLAPREVFLLLEAYVRAGRTLLIAGEVSTGKTTLLQALGAAIPAKEAVLVIEDTPEIRLLHPNTRYIRTLSANLEGAGCVTSAECIKAAMRCAMNRILFGEIRDPTAALSFIDVCTSGHPGMTSLHARSAADSLLRLELLLSRAESAGSEIRQQQIAAAVDAVVFLRVCRKTKVRRIAEIREVTAAGDGTAATRTMFRYLVHRGAPVWERVSAASSHLEGTSEAGALAGCPTHVICRGGKEVVCRGNKDVIRRGGKDVVCSGGKDAIHSGARGCSAQPAGIQTSPASKRSGGVC